MASSKIQHIDYFNLEFHTTLGNHTFLIYRSFHCTFDYMHPLLCSGYLSTLMVFALLWDTVSVNQTSHPKDRDSNNTLLPVLLQGSFLWCSLSLIFRFFLFGKCFEQFHNWLIWCSHIWPWHPPYWSIRSNLGPSICSSLIPCNRRIGWRRLQWGWVPGDIDHRNRSCLGWDQLWWRNSLLDPYLQKGAISDNSFGCREELTRSIQLVDQKPGKFISRILHSSTPLMFHNTA